MDVYATAEQDNPDVLPSTPEFVCLFTDSASSLLANTRQAVPEFIAGLCNGCNVRPLCHRNNHVPAQESRLSIAHSDHNNNGKRGYHIFASHAGTVKMLLASTYARQRSRGQENRSASAAVSHWREVLTYQPCHFKVADKCGFTESRLQAKLFRPFTSAPVRPRIDGIARNSGMLRNKYLINAMNRLYLVGFRKPVGNLCATVRILAD